MTRKYNVAHPQRKKTANKTKTQAVKRVIWRRNKNERTERI